MIKNYLKIAFRNFSRNKGYVFINVFGLAAGITCFVLITLYVQDELAYDQYHENADRIYRVVEVVSDAEESSSQPFPAGPTLREDFPHLVSSSVRFFNLQAPSLAISYEPSNGEQRSFNERRFFFTDSTVFDVFSFDLLRGDENTALDRPGTVVLTRNAAQRYFGSEDPIGKTLMFEGQHPLEVTGLLAEPPRTSHFTFDFLASFSTLRSTVYAQNPQTLENWYWNPVWTYVQLKEDVSPETLEAQFPDFVQKYFPEQLKDQMHMYLQPLTDIHLYSNLDFEIAANSDITYVYIFSVIAIFVLLIACINFMSLATARSATRAKEVGLRKVSGAVRGQLIRQFLTESTLLSLVALILAVPLIDMLLPVLNNMSGKTITLNLAENWSLVGLLGLVTLGVGLISGLYPALYLSSYSPVQVLKGSSRTGTGTGGTSALFRKGLVVAQFAISIALIAGTFIATWQLDHLRQARLGFDQEQVVMVPILRTSVASRYAAIKDELLQHTGVRSVTIAEDILGSKYQTQTFQPEGTTEPQQYMRMFVYDDALATFGIELLAGRDYSEERADEGLGIIINEAMVRHLGWGSPKEAIGRSMGDFGDTQARVIGVTENFHFASLHRPVGPFVLPRLPDNLGALNFFGRYLAIRIAPDDPQGALASIEETWNSFIPGTPFEYLFVDQEMDRLYRAEENLSRVAGAFSILALMIACLGLFGLAAYSAEQRVKEIGIRKVLGATVTNIVSLLSKDYLRLVAIGFVIAVPVSWYVMNRWLADFAYRIEINPLVFLMAGGLVLLVAILTVSWQAVKAAFMNPVNSLRNE